MSGKKLRILSQSLITRPFGKRAVLGSAALVACALLGGVAAFATSSSAAIQTAFQPKIVVENLGRPAVEKAPMHADVFVREERVSPSDTLGQLARRLGIMDADTYSFLLSDPIGQKVFEELRPGKHLTASTKANGELQSLVFPLNDQSRAIFVERNQGRLSSKIAPLPIESRVVIKNGEVKSSFFAAADDIDLPDSVTTQMAEIFGGSLDFHSDLRRGDRFSVIYEIGTHNGRPIRAGRVLAAEFINEGVAHRAIWFHDGNGSGSYYTPGGRSLKASFLRSPIEFSRITSGFSMRFHPILHKWRAHRGVDFGAPLGTPVRATSDGMVEDAGRHTGYGNLVVLRHNSNVTTHYGHLNGFAAGLKRGQRISQGQIIGYVGRTGWATGPHLHYEVRINDVQHDPLKVALPSNTTLKSQQLAAFAQHAAPLTEKLNMLRGVNLARLE